MKILSAAAIFVASALLLCSTEVKLNSQTRYTKVLHSSGSSVQV